MAVFSIQNIKAKNTFSLEEIITEVRDQAVIGDEEFHSYSTFLSYFLFLQLLMNKFIKKS